MRIVKHEVIKLKKSEMNAWELMGKILDDIYKNSTDNEIQSYVNRILENLNELWYYIDDEFDND